MKLRGSIPPIFGQLVRFGLVGAFSTVVYAAVYWPLATYVIHPVLAVVAGFAVAVSVGYLLHSRWSFRGHGKREESVQTQGRFVLVQSGGLVLNAFFTWVLTGLMHGPTWWPLIPAVVVTPLLGFVLNRRWVFG